MYNKLFAFIVLFSLLLPTINLNSQSAVPEKLPPVIIKTSPIAGNLSVDSNLQKISVTFSKKMQTKKMWSWVIYTKESFPQMTGQPYFLKDGKTCVLPVKLKPNTTYAMWINSGKYNYFKDLKGISAVPYLLYFKTK